MKSLFLPILFSSALALTLEGVRSVKDDIFLNETFETGYAQMEPRGRMFFWHIPARHDASSKPLMMWLSGGPGCGSELALMGINGPWNVKDDVSLELNPHSWTEVDQPLGSGFSYAEGNYKFTGKGVSKDLHAFIKAFLKLHPEYVNRPFFVTGESYAGHYIPNIGEWLIDHPIEGLDFKGIAVGNGWVDAVAQYPAYGEYAVETGLVSGSVAAILRQGFNICGAAMSTPLWPAALPVCRLMTLAALGDQSPYHVERKCEDPPMCLDVSRETSFLNREDVRSILGVDTRVGAWTACSPLVNLALIGDFGKSTLPALEAVLAAGKAVAIYYGDKDFICNYRGGERWMTALSGQTVHEDAHKSKKVWKPKKSIPMRPTVEFGEEDNKATGTIKGVLNLAFLRIFDAGHMVPADQPSRTLKMVRSFLDGSLFAPQMDDGNVFDILPEVVNDEELSTEVSSEEEETRTALRA